LFLVSASSPGLNVILPTYISQTHGVWVASASGRIADANLAMIAGVFLVGLLLMRGIPPRIMLAALAGGGIGFAVVILSLATPIGAVELVFAGWSFVLGAAQAMSLPFCPVLSIPSPPAWQQAWSIKSRRSPLSWHQLSFFPCSTKVGNSNRWMLDCRTGADLEAPPDGERK
jgi:hypothetical protein